MCSNGAIGKILAPWRRMRAHGEFQARRRKGQWSISKRLAHMVNESIKWSMDNVSMRAWMSRPHLHADTLGPVFLLAFRIPAIRLRAWMVNVSAMQNFRLKNRGLGR